MKDPPQTLLWLSASAKHTLASNSHLAQPSLAMDSKLSRSKSISIHMLKTCPSLHILPWRVRPIHRSRLVRKRRQIASVLRSSSTALRKTNHVDLAIPAPRVSKVQVAQLRYKKGPSLHGTKSELPVIIWLVQERASVLG